MNIRSVTALNFRSWPELDVELPLGATAIVGANGAGKSSIVHAIDYALFAGRGEGARLCRRGEAAMSVLVELEHGGERYVVHRGVEKGKPWLRFSRLPGDVLTLESVDATSQRIVETLGVTRETLRASSLLMQGDAAAWTEADPADRKRVLAGVLRLEEWDRLAALVKRDRGAAEHELAVAQGEVADEARLSLELRDLAAGAAQAERSVAELERELVFAEGLEANARTALEEVLAERARRSERERLHAAFLAAGREERRIVDALEERDRLAAEIEAMQPAAGRVEELAAQREVLREQSRRIDEWRAEMRAARDELERLTAEHDAAQLAARERLEACPTCGQELRNEALEHAQAARDAIADEASAAMLEAARRQSAVVHAEPLGIHPNLYADVERELMAAAAARQTVEALAARLASGEGLEAELDQAREALTAAGDALKACPAFDGEAPDEAQARDDVEAAGDEVRRTRGMLTSARAAADRLEGRAASLRERLSGLADTAGRVRLLLERCDLLERLHAAYSRDGVPALIVEQRAVPALESNANAILEEWGSPMRVELRTQRATLSGDVRETLDIVVHGDAGEGEYRDYSGGERTRLNVALRIALAILLSSSRGADVRTLIVDEPEYLDPDGQDALAEILRGLAAERFERVLLVSPKADLADALDQSITVAKDDAGCSRIGAL